MTENKKGQLVTRGIANKGFRGMRRVVARFNFSCSLIGNRPQSLTCHTANVMPHPKRRHDRQEMNREMKEITPTLQQNQKSCNPTLKAEPMQHICFCPTAPNITTLEFLINKRF